VENSIDSKQDFGMCKQLPQKAKVSAQKSLPQLLGCHIRNLAFVVVAQNWGKVRRKVKQHREIASFPGPRMRNDFDQRAAFPAHFHINYTFVGLLFNLT